MWYRLTIYDPIYNSCAQLHLQKDKKKAHKQNTLQIKSIMVQSIKVYFNKKLFTNF